MEYISTNLERINQLISDGGDFRTSPATPGLLKRRRRRRRKRRRRRRGRRRKRRRKRRKRRKRRRRRRRRRRRKITLGAGPAGWMRSAGLMGVLGSTEGGAVTTGGGVPVTDSLKTVSTVPVGV